MNRKVTFIICSLLLCSCKREVCFYFNFGSQSLCVYKSSFYNLSIENDSITPDGKSYEGALSLFWTDSANSPPQRIYLVLPYKPNISLIHSILYNKLFAYICKFLYLYIIILADIYA